MVTALFDLGRARWPHFRRSFDIYLAYSIHLLSLDIPLVAYVEPKVEPFVRYFRDSKPTLTHLVVSDLTELPFAKQYGKKIADVMQSEEFKRDNKILNHPEGFSVEYNVLMNAKLSMLKESVERNHFHSSHFYWIDMGYGHGNPDFFPEDHCWAPTNIMDNLEEITYIAVNEIDQVQSIFQLYKQRVGPGVNGAFFGGSIKAVQDYHNLYTEVLDDFIHHDMMDDDQTLALECYLRRPQLFNMVRGDWYDVFGRFQ